MRWEESLVSTQSGLRRWVGEEESLWQKGRRQRRATQCHSEEGFCAYPAPRRHSDSTSQAVQARVGYLLGSRSDPTQTARVGFEQVGPVGRRME